MEKDHLIRLEPNEHYWDRKNVLIHALEVCMVKDGRVALEMYEKGDLDWIGDPFTPLPQDALEELKKSPKLRKKEIARVCIVYFNTRQFPLQSKKIRQALDLAINREELSEHVLLSQRAHLSTVPVPYSLIKQYDYPLSGNEVLAKQLFKEGLEELQIDGTSFPPLTFSYMHEGIFKNIALYLQRRWETVLGIKVNLRGYDWNLLFADLNRHQFEISSCYQANFFADPIYNLSMFEQASQTVNWAGWENSDYRSLLHESREMTDTEKRNACLEQAEKILVEERPVIPLYVHTFFFKKKDYIHNLQITDLGYVEFKYVDKI